jgi:hypothetical protein
LSKRIEPLQRVVAACIMTSGRFPAYSHLECARGGVDSRAAVPKSELALSVLARLQIPARNRREDAPWRFHGQRCRWSHQRKERHRRSPQITARLKFRPAAPRSTIEPASNSCRWLLPARFRAGLNVLRVSVSRAGRSAGRSAVASRPARLHVSTHHYMYA